jgi:SAM-dependent methyltransferase
MRRKPPTLATVFDRIYRVNYWGGTESLSGRGSGTEATKALAVDLLDLIAALDVTSVLDLGCGDGFWMPPLPGYIGVDVSAVALRSAQARHPEREYRLDDGTPYPRRELVIARHVMQHLSLAEGTRLLNRVRASGAQWLLATTYLMGSNRDIANGRVYWPDLRAQPFNLGDPVSLLEDEGGAVVGLQCRLGLWPITA